MRNEIPNQHHSMARRSRSKVGTGAAAIASAVAFTMLATTLAEARPSTRNFTCDGVRDFVADRGAVVMNHKSSSLYRRFVSGFGFCSFDERRAPFTVPTRDGACRLYICKPFSRFKRD
ncbi:MAG: hypothetical protein AAF035_09265 [Pseudomonadota bacterium]